jgi:hypothetical protein
MAPYGREPDRPKIVVVMPAYDAAKISTLSIQILDGWSNSFEMPSPVYEFKPSSTAVTAGS